MGLEPTFVGQFWRAHPGSQCLPLTGLPEATVSLDLLLESVSLSKASLARCNMPWLVETGFKDTVKADLLTRAKLQGLWEQAGCHESWTPECNMRSSGSRLCQEQGHHWIHFSRDFPSHSCSRARWKLWRPIFGADNHQLALTWSAHGICCLP